MSARDIERNLQELHRAMMAKGAQGLFEAGNMVMTDAKQRVPVDLGALKGSGYVTAPTPTPGGMNVEIGFGGPAAGYAIYVHEDLSPRHPVGEAKYLENAVDARAQAAFAHVAKRVEEAIHG
jgi:hypothetical protein